jgi:hypothetical protein
MSSAALGTTLIAALSVVARDTRRAVDAVLAAMDRQPPGR